MAEEKRVFDPDNFEEETMIGTVTSAEFAELEDERSGEMVDKLILSLDVDFMENPFVMRIKYSKKKNSLYWHVMNGFKYNCKLAIKSVKDLVGKKILFTRTDISFGQMKDRDTGEMKEVVITGYPIPTSVIKD